MKVEISDCGVGISQEVLPKIFDPFFTTKDPDRGTGLGLTISKSIVESFHGSIDIQSKIDGGTTATITFPSIQ